MNALTKAFVVVVTILSVVLVALVIPFAARVPDYASQYEQMQLDRDAQLLKAQEAAAEVRNAIAAKGSELETALASITELTAELDRANNDKSALEARLAQAQLTVERNSAAMQIAAAESQSKSQRLEELNNLINQQLSTISDLTSQRSDLSQSLIELRSDNRRLTSNYRRIQEQNKSLEQQLLETNAQLTVATEKLAGFVEDVETELASVVNPPVDIRGSVTNISQITDGLTFVQVNVGTRDLVKEGMEFTVYRGDSFVGKIKIASVDTAESVGQLTLSEMNVQEGDLVRAGGR